MDITIQEKEFVIINIYGPNHDNGNVFFEKLNDIIDIEKNIIIGGDLNTVLSIREMVGKIQIKNAEIK